MVYLPCLQFVFFVYKIITASYTECKY